jgi:UDP-2,4-diacetamido-2,4,6-trideoxy-beta-L-altropyranose hydrolase
MPLNQDLPPLLVRADASTAQGTGHVLRCLALVEAWRARGGPVRFASCCPAPTIRRRIDAAGALLIELQKPYPARGDCEQMLSTIEQLERAYGTSPWVVVDGYHFDASYQTDLRASPAWLLVVDDNAHRPHYDADIVLNHGIHAPQLAYDCTSDAKLLLGSQYALIRPEFLRYPTARRTNIITARNILVTLGGSDPDNVSGIIIDALLGLDDPGLRARILVGPMNPHLEALRQIASADRRVTIETTVDDMGALMLWADIAIAGAGGTCWELAFLGVPMLNVVLADNQRAVAARLEQAQISVNLGWHTEMTPSLILAKLAPLMNAPTVRAAMSARGQALIDGRGTERVIAAMTAYRLGRGVADTSRKANKERGSLCSKLAN